MRRKGFWILIAIFLSLETQADARPPIKPISSCKHLLIQLHDRWTRYDTLQIIKIFNRSQTPLKKRLKLWKRLLKIEADLSARPDLIHRPKLQETLRELQVAVMLQDEIDILGESLVKTATAGTRDTKDSLSIKESLRQLSLSSDPRRAPEILDYLLKAFRLSSLSVLNAPLAIQFLEAIDHQLEVIDRDLKGRAVLYVPLDTSPFVSIIRETYNQLAFFSVNEGADFLKVLLQYPLAISAGFPQTMAEDLVEDASTQRQILAQIILSHFWKTLDEMKSENIVARQNYERILQDFAELRGPVINEPQKLTAWAQKLSEILYQGSEGSLPRHFRKGKMKDWDQIDRIYLLDSRRFIEDRGELGALNFYIAVERGIIAHTLKLLRY